MGRVVHFEIHADDPDRAAAFYTALLGWTITKWEGPMEYWMIVTGPDGTMGINGGLLRRNHPLTGNDGVTAYVCTVGVENLDQTIARCQELGGSLAMPEMPIPEVGRLAYLKDTEGNIFGVLQPDMAAK